MKNHIRFEIFSYLSNQYIIVWRYNAKVMANKTLMNEISSIYLKKMDDIQYHDNDLHIIIPTLNSEIRLSLTNFSTFHPI